MAEACDPAIETCTNGVVEVDGAETSLWHLFGMTMLWVSQAFAPVIAAFIYLVTDDFDTKYYELLYDVAVMSISFAGFSIGYAVPVLMAVVYLIFRDGFFMFERVDERLVWSI